MSRHPLPCLLLAAASAWAGSQRVLHTAYFNPAGREPAAAYAARIDRIMTDIQSFYRDEMKRNGYGSLTFALPRDAKGQLVIHLVQGDKPYSRDKGPDFGEVRNTYVKPALAAKGIDIENEHVVIFQNLIWRDGDTLQPRAPYGGSGNAWSGTAWVTDIDILDTRNFTVHEPFVVDRGRRQSISRYNVIQIGGVAHELGHAFGLPHNKESDQERQTLGTALMGAGNYTYRNERAGGGKGSFITPAHALALSTHPLLQRGDASRRVEPKCELADIRFRQEGPDLVVNGKAESSLPMAGAVLYNDRMPTGINKDYDARSWGATVGAQGAFAFRVPGPTQGDYHLSLRIYHANGAWKTFAFDYAVGVISIDRLNRAATLLRARAAWEARDRARLDTLLAELRGGGDEAARKAAVLDQRLTRWERRVVLADVPATQKAIALTAGRWESASVGWLEPCADRILLSDLGHTEPIRSGQRKHDRGLYAHAPAAYTYDLGGKWKSLTGSCGLQNGHRGSVQFVIRGDGKELHRSEVVRDGKERSFRIDVTGVRRLELICDPTPDGRNSDWGMWLDPELSR